MPIHPPQLAIRAGLAASMLVGGLTAPALGQAPEQTPFSVLNAPTEAFGPDAALLSPDGAHVTRLADRLVVEIEMPAPVPGTYVYPTSVPPDRYASPEAFTLWAFVFNHPEACVSDTTPPRCGPDDFSDAAQAGIYGVAGHVTAVDHSGGAFELDRDSDGRMRLHGEILVGQPPRADMPPDVPLYALADPANAEVHLAVAPHGQVDPATIATELYDPAGDPSCGCWWLAFFASTTTAAQDG